MKNRIPNLLTSSRIMLSPFVYYAGFAREKELFVILFTLGGLTDFLDGFFARYMEIDSDWGSVFDTVADGIFYPAGLLVYLFVPEVFHYWTVISAFIGLFLVALIVGWLRGALKIPHLVSAKIFAMSSVAFVFYTLLFDYYPPFLFVFLAIGAWAALEQFIVLCFRKPSFARKWSWE